MKKLVLGKKGVVKDGTYIAVFNLRGDSMKVYNDVFSIIQDMPKLADLKHNTIVYKVENNAIWVEPTYYIGRDKKVVSWRVGKNDMLDENTIAYKLFEANKIRYMGLAERLLSGADISQNTLKAVTL